MIVDALIGIGIIWAMMAASAALMGVIYVLCAPGFAPMWVKVLIGAIILSVCGAAWGIAVTP